MTCFQNEVDSCYLLLSVIISLIHNKLFHFDIVILTEQLQETESSAKSQLVIQFGLYFKFISFVSKHFDQDVLFSIKMIIWIYDFEREVSLLLVFFELSDFNQKVADISNQILQTYKSRVRSICYELIEKRVLTVSVSVI